MKIAVIGGAGVRTPLLVGGLTRSDLPIEQIALYDVDRTRLATIGARRRSGWLAKAPRDSRASRSPNASRGPTFVFTSIRVGGIAQRVRDESVAQRHGIVGQETVGPAGFAMAMRTIPPMVRYAREIAAAAPRAWIVNFTNPVGMVTEAMRTVERPRHRHLRHADRAVRGGRARARSRVRRLLLRLLRPEPSRLAARGLQRRRAAAAPAVGRCRAAAPDLQGAAVRPGVAARAEAAADRIRLLLRSADRAFDNVRRAGRSRGQVIEELTRALFESLARAWRRSSSRVYEQYLRTRSAGYMQIEAGTDAPSTAGSCDRAQRLRPDRARRRARDPLQREHDHPAQRRQPRQHRRPAGRRCRRGAVRGERATARGRCTSGRVPERDRAAADAREGVRAADGARPRWRSRRRRRATRSRTIRWCRIAATADALIDATCRRYGDARSRHGPAAGHRDEHHRHGRRRAVPDHPVHGHGDERAAHHLRVGVRRGAGALRRPRLRASSAPRCLAAAARTSTCARPTSRSGSAG